MGLDRFQREERMVEGPEAIADDQQDRRSEERRVGEEGRGVGAQCSYRKKRKRTVSGKLEEDAR